MNISPEQARARLLQLYLTVDNLRTQLETSEQEIRDLRNYIAGTDASATQAQPTE
jgi:hypothetical protein